MELTNEGIRTLKIIGRLMQSKTQPPNQIIKIELKPGENYPEAVLRVLSELPAERQRALDDAAIFSMETEDSEYNMAA